MAVTKSQDQTHRLPIALALPPIPIQGFDVNGMYPLGQFTFLSKYPSCQAATWTGDFQQPNKLLRKLKMSKDYDWVGHREEGQGMVHIELLVRSLLVVLDYKDVTVKRISWQVLNHKLGCRVFGLPGDFSEELLRRLFKLRQRHEDETLGSHSNSIVLYRVNF
jgi:hypothetical protein